MSLIVWIGIIAWVGLAIAVVVLCLAARRLDDEIADEETRESRLAAGYEESPARQHPADEPRARQYGSSSTRGRKDPA